MKRVMLDLETMGTCANSAIISIGAVSFGGGCIIDEFYKVIDLKSCVNAGLEIEPDTVMWWMKQGNDAKEKFSVDGVALTTALISFAEWIDKDTEMWGNGAAFDNVILANAYKKCGMPVPWSFYNDRCYRTVKNLNPKITIERKGVYHCAIDDAKSQALHLMSIIES